jgi:hypothetical protein
MTHRPIIDAGPSLNFFSINKERLLISVLGRLSAPETVEAEVLHKSRTDKRFSAAARTWAKLKPDWIEILSDSVTPELAAVVSRITSVPRPERLRTRRNLGELMVVAHAVVAAEAGKDVTVLIDDGDGARMAMAEVRRLERLSARGQTVGSIRLASTLTVLQRAAGGPYIPDKGAMRDIYRRLRALDDGLPPIERTNLLSPNLWT